MVNSSQCKNVQAILHALLWPHTQNTCTGASLSGNISQKKTVTVSSGYGRLGSCVCNDP